MTWDELVQGYWIARRRELSATTQAGYRWVFDEFGRFVGARPVESLTSADIQAFLDVQEQRGISRRTLSDRWVILSSLWTWASRALGLPHLIRDHVTRPQYTRTAIISFSEEEIKALVRAAEWGAPWIGKQGKPVRSKRPTAKRERALILTLLDTGLRVSEFCALTVADYNADQGRLHVRHGKGDKARLVYMGDTARMALWTYRLTVGATGMDAPLFPTRSGRAMTRDNVRHTLERIGANAHVSDVHPHRFRHTFAVTFLRNGGNVFELQRILGHEGLETVRTYLQLAQTDIATAQRKHSPADGWRL
jgi:integrase/recombinase XerD